MEEDKLREAAIEIAASSLRSNLKQKSGINSSQLSKFQSIFRQELHRRRLNIKAKSKVKKKGRGFHDGDKKHEEMKGVTENGRNEETSAFAGTTSSSVQQVEVEAHNVTTGKRQKLHWGLDTKERWEMKANM